MRYVASSADCPAGVLGGDYLRETRRFGGILFVTAPADVGDVGQFGDVGLGVVGVFRQRSVAGFTGDVGMFAGRADFRLIVMAHHTGLLPGVCDGAGADQVERAGPVVAIPAEVLGDDGGPHYEKDTHGGNENQCRTDQVYPIMKQTAQGAPLFERLNCCHG